MMDTFSISADGKDIELLRPAFITCVIGYENNSKSDYPMQCLLNCKNVNITNAKEIIETITEHFKNMGWLGDTND